MSYNQLQPVKTLHYAPVKRTADQTYNLVGTRLDETVSVRIRRNPTVTEDYQVKLADGVTYKIIQIDRDAGVDIIGYDYLTLKKVNGRS